MFAYCGNNPVCLYDEDGNAPCSATNFDKISLNDDWASGYGGGGSALLPLICGIDTWRTPEESIDDWVENQQNIVANQVANSLARSKTKHSDTKHLHHIVPQNDLRGLPAYIVVQEVFPNQGVDDPRNTVIVSSRIHARLHTTQYYTLVNVVVTAAYLSAGDNAFARAQNVEAALNGLKIFIGALELLP